MRELAGDDPRHTVRRAGFRRLVRACLAESPEFASKLAERHRDELGRMLIASIRTERAHGRARTGERLKVDVVAHLEQLAERGLVERPVRLAPPQHALRNRIATDDLRDPPPRAPSHPPAPLPVERPPRRSQVRRDPDGSSLHRMPVRPQKVVRGDAAAQARPARPKRERDDDT